jgi:PKD repeat protein
MGVAQCSNGTFQIQTDLLPGANSMQAKVYNVTNDEGPVSQPVTLYYDEVKLQPQTPATTPTNVWIENVGASPYHTGVSTSTSDRPTITGFAPPFSDITVTFHSDPVVCKTQADDKGWWTCTLQQSLPEGTHHVEVWAYSPSGEKIPCPVFSIVVKLGLPNLLKSHGSKPPLLIITDYYFQTHYIGQPFRWNMTFSSGAAPYKLNIDWGDGNQSTVTRTDGSAFPLTHAFVPSKTYTVFMTVTDANGETAMVQLSAVVKDEPIGPASITNSGPIASVLASIKQYLWVVWPVYIAVVLMVMSYWLGEQEMYQRLVKRHVTRHGKER